MTDNFDFENYTLDTILDQVAPEMAEQQASQVEEDAPDGLLFMKFIQATVQLGENIPKGIGAGKYVALGRNTDKGWQGYFFQKNQVKFNIVEALPEYLRTKGSGEYIYRPDSRTMWPVDAITGQNDPEQKNPVCKSTDGLAPLARFVGDTIAFPLAHKKMRGALVRIGYEADGVTQVPVAEICERCPFSQWHYVKDDSPSLDGKKKNSINIKPMCNHTWRIVIFLPPQKAYKYVGKEDNDFESVEFPGGMAIMQGAPNSVQVAFEGTTGSGKAQDGRGLPGIMRFKRHAGQGRTYVEKKVLNRYMVDGKLAPKMDAMLAGFSMKPDSEKVEPKTDANFENEKLKYAVLDVPTFHWATYGTPELVGWDAAAPGLHWLTFDIVANDWNQHPYVPLFAVHNDLVGNDKHYAMFLQAIVRFRTEKMKDFLLYSSNLQAVEQALLSAPQTAGHLPEGDTTTINVGDIQDM